MSLLTNAQPFKKKNELPPLTKEEISGKRPWKRITLETKY